MCASYPRSISCFSRCSPSWRCSCLYPVFIIVVDSFTTGLIGQARHWSLAPWRAALADPGMRAAIANTLKIVAANESISLPLAVLVSWVLARTDLPLRGALEFMFWVTFFLPPLSVTLGWVVLLDPQKGLLNLLFTALPFVRKAPFDIYSFWGIVWSHLSTSTLSIKVMLLTPLLRNIDASFEETARICGASKWRTLFRIVVPIAAPAILTVMVLSIIRAMQTFEIEMVLGPPFNFWVFGTIIYRLVNQIPPEFGSATALSIIAFAIISPLIVLHRYLLARRDFASIEGRMRLAPTRLGRWRYPIFALLALFVFCITVLPVSFVVLSSFMKLFGFFNLAEPWTLANWETMLHDDFFIRSLMNTAILAAGTAVASILFCALIAYFTVRSHYRGKGLLDFLSWLPFAIPGILLGVGLLSVVLGNPLFRLFYGSLPLLVVAVVIANMTLGTQILKAAMLQIGAGLEEAARTTGATWWYAFGRVAVPILMPTLILVGLINFIGATRDIASVALLAANDTRTLSLLQLNYIIDGKSEAAAVISVVVIALTIGIAVAARLLGLRLGIRA